MPINTFHERIELADGDFLDVNRSWSPASETRPEKIVCIFHGLAGCIDSRYANGVMRALAENNIDFIFMHFRGCSGEPNRLAASYHSGHTADIRFLIELQKKQHPDATLHAVGFSLGGNALLKYLGEEGPRSQLASAVAISPPLVLEEGANRLTTGVSRIYQRYLLGLMLQQLENKRERYPDLPLPVITEKLDTFWKFDDVVTAPLTGFKDVHDYYAKCGAGQYLSKIRVPTHVISAIDDPFFSPRIIPEASELAECVTLEVSNKGGHVGFVSGNLPWRPDYWLDKRIVETLQL